MLSLLSLYPASPAQIEESRRRTYKEWGRGMTEEEYLERDRINDQSECARDGKLITWVLAPRNAPESLDFFCSCETYRRHGIIIRRTNPSSGCEDAFGYGVACVFTSPIYRHKGYARHMLRLLQWVLAPEEVLPKIFPEEWGKPPTRVAGVGNAYFSALWSAVGLDFYRQCGLLPDSNDGWVVDKPISTTWDVLGFTGDLGHRPESSWVWLDELTIKESWKLETEMMRGDLAKNDDAGLPTQYVVGFSFLPHQGVADFQYCRTRFFWEKLDPRPSYWGIISANSSDIFVSWTIKFETLLITRLRASPDKFELLLIEVMIFARQHSVEKVEVWNLDSNLHSIAQKLGGKTFKRTGSLPAFKWYGQESAEKVQWMFNERFCWC